MKLGEKNPAARGHWGSKHILVYELIEQLS